MHVRKTNGTRLAEAIAAERIDEFGNPVQPRRLHRQSRNARLVNVAKDIDTDGRF